MLSLVVLLLLTKQTCRFLPKVSVLSSVPTGKSILNDGNNFYDSESIQKLTTQILLEKAKATAANEKEEVGDGLIKTFSFSFKAKHTHKIDLPGVDLADAYLSLPASNYSILSSSIISRSPSSEKNNTFILSIPLGDYRVIDANLQAEVIVDPQPESCRVLMESSNIVFLPTQVMKQRTETDYIEKTYRVDANSSIEVDSGNFSVSSSSDGDDAVISSYLGDSLTNVWQSVEANSSVSSEEVTASLPSWLIWGGEGSTDDYGGVATNGSAAFKSSIQVKLQVELRWRRGQTGGAGGNPLSWLRSGFKRVFASPDSKSTSASTLASKQSNLTQALVQVNSSESAVEETALSVEASVRVWVEGNIPLKGASARKVFQTPLGRLVPLVGTIVASSAMKGLAPILGNLLVSDYMSRRHTLVKNENKVSTDDLSEVS